MSNKKDGDIIDLYENNIRVNFYYYLIFIGYFSWNIDTYYK